MKLQELLRSVNIEKVLPIIEKWYYIDEGDEFTCKEGYVKAYNELCQMTPADINTRYDDMEELEIEGYEEDYVISAPDGEFTTPWCMKLEFRRWDILIDKDIHVEEGLQISTEEMAAVCLWHITFCGFDSGAVQRTYRKWDVEKTLDDRERKSDYWNFISDYLPDYYTNDNVLLSNLLYRYLTEDDFEPEDKEMIESKYGSDKEKVRKYLCELDKSLMADAIDAYFDTMYVK